MYESWHVHLRWCMSITDRLWRVALIQPARGGTDMGLPTSTGGLCRLHAVKAWCRRLILAVCCIASCTEGVRHHIISAQESVT